MIWAGSIVTRARHENRIVNDYASKHLIDRLDTYRSLCGGLLNYDWITVPLVYTQVVTLAVYTFLLSTLLGSQFLDPGKNYAGYESDLYVPVFTFLQFFFYMGWLKVAEALINPFGEDDDDFDMNWFIDRNIQVSYLIVDEMHAEHPELIKDNFWDTAFPELPYTAAADSANNPENPFIGAAANIEVPEEEAEFLPRIEEDEDGDDEDGMFDDDDDEDEDVEAGKVKKNGASSKGNSKMPGIVFRAPSMGPDRKKKLLRKRSQKRQNADDADSMTDMGSRPSLFMPTVLQRLGGAITGNASSSSLLLSNKQAREYKRQNSGSRRQLFPLGRSVSRISRGGGPRRGSEHQSGAGPSSPVSHAATALPSSNPSIDTLHRADSDLSLSRSSRATPYAAAHRSINSSRADLLSLLHTANKKESAEQQVSAGGGQSLKGVKSDHVLSRFVYYVHMRLK